jgi:hypothetical protein
VGVAVGTRQQDKLSHRGIGKAITYGLLLLDDESGGGVGDRQPHADPVVLEVGVDQRVLAIRVLFDAIPGQLADLVRAAAGVHQKLDGNTDLSPIARLKLRKGRDQLPQDDFG